METLEYKGFPQALIIHKTFENCKSPCILRYMISKYTYKDMTWVDLESPTKEEMAHVLESKPENSLHFIIGNNTLITSRHYSTPEIATFAKNFEMNLALEKPVQMDTIDLLFFELLSFFRQNSEDNKYAKLLQEKDDDIFNLININQRMNMVYRRKIFYLCVSMIVILCVIIYLYLWH